MRPDHYSVSSISLFDTCPSQWKARYVDGIKEEPNRAMLWGSLVHEGIEGVNTVLEARQSISPDEVSRVWDEVFKRTGSKAFDGEDFISGYHGLSEYAATFAQDPLIGAERMVAVDIAGRKLLAKMDRGDVSHNGVRAVEVKSSARIPSKEEVDADFQMSIYAVVLRKLFPDLLKYRDINVAYYSFAKAALVPVIKDEEEIKLAEQYLISCFERIETETVFAPKINGRCHGCPVKSGCPEYLRVISGKAGEVAYTDLISGDVQSLVNEFERHKAYGKLIEERSDSIKELVEAEVLKAGGSLPVKDGYYKFINQETKGYPVPDHVKRFIKKIKGVKKGGK